ncbi:MAG TPA: sigma-70 family RNA polymerase sigma factor [Solirubrobacterales bacterium]
MLKAAESHRFQMTSEELDQAKTGVKKLLCAKRFPREWIERHLDDLTGQALTDYSARLAAGRKDKTLGLLVVIGYRRAIKTLEKEIKDPAPTSIETIYHLADESTLTPEEEAIENDRSRRIAQAMSLLSGRERELIALVYYEGNSVREAGRLVGWGKSSADRHHHAALDRLSEVLDRSLLGP